jgi:ABC-type transport system involved in multi-copper enzyme maturation permease subunit
MLTLIRREVVDHAVHLFLAAALSAVVIVLLIYQDILGQETQISAIAIPVLVALYAFCFMGAMQMSSDRGWRISSFISTLPVTRGQILLARLLVGLLAILLVLVPVGVMGVVILQNVVPPFQFYSHVVAHVWVTAFLAALASYGLGLNVGWRGRKGEVILGVLVLPSFVVALLAFKGYDMGAIVVLALLALASLASTAVKFCSTPL